MQALGRTAEVQFLGHGNEITQVAQLHLLIYETLLGIAKMRWFW